MAKFLCVSCLEICEGDTSGINGRGMCSPCANKAIDDFCEGGGVAIRYGQELNPRWRNSMTQEIDWAQVKREKDAGSTGAELATKYGVSAQTIYNHIRELADGNGASASVRKRNVSIKHPDYSAMVNDLRAQRDRLDAAISAIEAIAPRAV